jgi:flagellar biosynthesis regulator FlbT
MRLVEEAVEEAVETLAEAILAEIQIHRQAEVAEEAKAIPEHVMTEMITTNLTEQMLKMNTHVYNHIALTT